MGDKHPERTEQERGSTTEFGIYHPTTQMEDPDDDGDEDGE
jgi:hypothetical protein